MTQPELRKPRGMFNPSIILLIILILLASGVAAILTLRDRADYAFPGDPVLPPGDAAPPPEPLPVTPSPVEPFWPEPLFIPRPRHVKGIYVTGYSAGKGDLAGLIYLVKNTELNAMVIDTKADEGWLTYPRTEVPWAEEAGALGWLIDDPAALIARLAKEGVYPIARIVVFKDSIMPLYRPDLAIQSRHGGLWRGDGNYWLDPYNKENWKYTVALAREAAAIGFREIQFDYIRFPSDGDVHNAVYPAYDGTPINEVIPAFLRYARASLAEYGVEVSVDIFGLVPVEPGGMGIGQHLESLSAEVDIICPMVYPSHYGPGNLGIPDPDAAPYDTVYRTLREGVYRLNQAGLDTVIRPWLQDFSIGHIYGAAEVRAQIQAAADLGLHEFLLWNAANYYHWGALRGPDKD
jgi:hypothetical protein